MTEAIETELSIGPAAINNFSRLSYQMWYALAEFIDNSTQSRANYGHFIDDVLAAEGTALTVNIVHNRVAKEIYIEDNSIGMTGADLITALRIAHPTPDSKGRSKYGMGMKTAACWIGKKWTVVTTEWGSDEEWTASVDVEQIAHHGARVPLSMKHVAKDKHYTKLVISDLNRHIQKRTEETIRAYLGSMYRYDLREGLLNLTYNGEPIVAPDDYEMDTDVEGKPYRQEFVTIVGEKSVKGWFGVLRKGGRKFGGFSLFQNRRQIQGLPLAWKPRSIYGGIDDEGANNLVAQRLTGVIELDGFEVSHTKDAVLFSGDEEEVLEEFLIAATKDYRTYAQGRRGERGQPFSREKVQDILQSLRSEFVNDEFADTLNTSLLPPIDTIVANNRQQVASLSGHDRLVTFDLIPDLKVTVSEQERSDYDPYVTIVANAEPGVIHVIINGLHPYYSSLESAEAMEECVRQYLYDAIAEYRVSKQQGRVNPDSARRLKDALLRAKLVHVENNAASARGDEDVSARREP